MWARKGKKEDVNLDKSSLFKGHSILLLLKENHPNVHSKSEDTIVSSPFLSFEFTKSPKLIK